MQAHPYAGQGPDLIQDQLHGEADGGEQGHLQVGQKHMFWWHNENIIKGIIWRPLTSLTSISNSMYQINFMDSKSWLYNLMLLWVS